MSPTYILTVVSRTGTVPAFLRYVSTDLAQISDVIHICHGPAGACIHDFKVRLYVAARGRGTHDTSGPVFKGV